VNMVSRCSSNFIAIYGINNLAENYPVTLVTFGNE
jgi:hypothetical protein